MEFKKKYILFILFLYMLGYAAPVRSATKGHDSEDSVWTLKKPLYSIRIVKKGFRYAILKPDGSTLLQAHAQSGLVLLNSDVVDSHLISQADDQAEFGVTNDVGIKATVKFILSDTYFKMSVSYVDKQLLTGSIIARTQGLAPAYGLADNATYRASYNTEVTGFYDKEFSAKSAQATTARLVSNFVIFPKQGLACINLDPDKKIVKVTADDLSQGSDHAQTMPAMYYFIGSVKQIYADYLRVRNAEGYKVYLPKYAWFGVGWEAWGALAWDTNYKTVTADVDHYISAGFPLSWMVVGSGFWPNDEPRLFTTTSFGAWDPKRYPDPKGFIDHFHQENLKFILGLRISFIPNGLFTDEGVKNGYFIKKNGVARLFKIAFPKTDCYFLDAQNPAAVKWYDSLCKKWEAAGVDGFKEDLYGYEITDFNDNKVDPINETLMDRGVYVMGRNGYVGSPMDLHRLNDFNYNQNQDRGPVNGLAFSYSGFPYSYPDIIGGTGLADNQFGAMKKERIGKYLMRVAQYAAVNPSMSFGYGPWHLDNKQVLDVCRSAAQLHERLHAYIYSAAVKTYLTGFPYTLTPLPLSYPGDSTVYYRENDKVRGFQWMVGEALMAIPLYGNDYAKTDTRDIYLPAGKWIDYDNGKVYQGQTLLKNFSVPVDKTPLFVGGTGFVVEKIDGKLRGRAYPVGFEGETDFYDTDGKTKSTISINMQHSKAPVITDKSTGKKVKAQYNRFAYEFAFIPGHNYNIK